MPTTPLALLGFGFVLGIRHALDVDHLAAVSTILSERRSLWRSSLVGMVWGLGHTVSLLVMAINVAVIVLIIAGIYYLVFGRRKSKF
jgi:high-affinity nickel permease